MRNRPSADRRRPHRISPFPTALLVGPAVALGLALPMTAGAEVETPFDGGMPLVLKDGRIATVTVHVVPFETGEGEIDATTAADLQEIFDPLATDCFLTAQAIGHVAPGVTRDGDTLSAHRLARARADALQAALVDVGMPQASVASVWDWQFLLPESRATVWVFSLTRGDDCDGTPLPQGEPAVAAAEGEAITASAEPLPDAEPAPESRPTDVPLDTTADAAPPASRPAEPEPDDTTLAEPTPADPGPAELRVAGSEAEPESPEAAETDPLATAAVAPAETPMPADDAPAAEAAAAAAAADDAAAGETATSPIDVAAIDPEAQHSATAGAAALAIDFDINSSYFSAGATDALRAFLDSLPAEGAVEIELAGAVGTSGVRGASDEEAERYNAWMAERRIERVAEWLRANAGDRRLTIAERLVENDPSRQVRLRVDTGNR